MFRTHYMYFFVLNRLHFFDPFKQQNNDNPAVTTYRVLQSSRAFKANFTISTNTGRTTHSNLFPPFITFCDDAVAAAADDDDDDGCVLMMDDESVVSRDDEEEEQGGGGGDELGVTI